MKRVRLLRERRKEILNEHRMLNPPLQMKKTGKKEIKDVSQNHITSDNNNLENKKKNKKMKQEPLRIIFIIIIVLII